MSCRRHIRTDVKVNLNWELIQSEDKKNQSDGSIKTDCSFEDTALLLLKKKT